MIHLMNISRRKLLGTAGAAAALTLAPQMSFAQAPKSGGDLVIAINGASTGNSLDPRTFNSPFMGVVSGARPLASDSLQNFFNCVSSSALLPTHVLSRNGVPRMNPLAPKPTTPLALQKLSQYSIVKQGNKVSDMFIKNCCCCGRVLVLLLCDVTALFYLCVQARKVLSLTLPILCPAVQRKNGKENYFYFLLFYTTRNNI